MGREGEENQQRGENGEGNFCHLATKVTLPPVPKAPTIQHMKERIVHSSAESHVTIYL